MKNRSGPSAIFVFLLGIAIGIAVSILFGAIVSYTNADTLLNNPKAFGDIKVYAGRPTDVGCPPDPNIDEMLVMEKDGVCFLTIHKNKAGQVTGLYLVKSTADEPIFFMEPLNAQGKWGRAAYSRGKGVGHPVGDVFIDIDFDGQFDFKMVVDNEGKAASRSIYLDGDWQNVDHANIKQMKAATKEGTLYKFDPNVGCWQQE